MKYFFIKLAVEAIGAIFDYLKTRMSEYLNRRSNGYKYKSQFA